MYDFKSNEEMQLVAMHNQAAWTKPGKGHRYVKPSILARLLGFLGVL